MSREMAQSCQREQAEFSLRLAPLDPLDTLAGAINQLQPRESVATSGAAEARRLLVAHQPAATPRQDGRTLCQACALLLAAVGGESSDPTPVRGDAPAHLAVTGSNGLTTSRASRATSDEG